MLEGPPNIEVHTTEELTREFKALVDQLHTDQNNLRCNGPFDESDGEQIWEFLAEKSNGSTIYVEVRFYPREGVFKGVCNTLEDYDEDGFKLDHLQPLLEGLRARFSQLQ